MTPPNVLPFVFRAGSPQDDPRLQLAYRRMARAVVEQFEEVKKARAAGVDCGCYNEVAQ